MNFITVIIFFGIVIGIALLINHYTKRKTPIAVRFPVKFAPGQNIINLTDKEQYKIIFAPSSLNTPIGNYPSYTLQTTDGTLLVIPQLTIENNDFVLVTEGNTAADPLIGLGSSLEVNLAHDTNKPFHIDLSTKPAVPGTASVNTIRGTLSVTIPDGPTFESLVGQPGVTPDWLVTDITNRIIGLTALATDEEDAADRQAAFEELERQMVKTSAMRQSSEDGQLNAANANQIYSVLQQVERTLSILTQRAKANNPDLDAMIGECLDSSAQVDPNSSKIDLSPSGSLGRHAMTIHTPTLYAAVVADMKALSDERDALAKEQPEGTVDKPAAPDFWLPTQLSVAINDLAVFINSVIHAEQQSGGLIDEIFVKSVAETPINVKLANCDKAFSDIVAATHFSSTDIPKEWPSAVVNVPVALSVSGVVDKIAEDPAKVEQVREVLVGKIREEAYRMYTASGKDLLQLNLSELVRSVTYAALTAPGQPERTPEEMAAIEAELGSGSVGVSSDTGLFVPVALGTKYYDLLEKIVTSTSLEQDLAVVKSVLKEYLLKLQDMRNNVSTDAERIAFNDLAAQAIVTAIQYNKFACTEESKNLLDACNALTLGRIEVLLVKPADLAAPPPMIDLQFGGPVGFSPENNVDQTSSTETTTENKVVASTPGMREVEVDTIDTPVVKRPKRPRGSRPHKDKSSY